MWISAERRSRLNEASARGRRSRIDGERLGKISGRVLRVSRLEQKLTEVDVCGRVARVSAQRCLKRRTRAIAAAERRARRPEEVLGPRVIGMTVGDLTHGRLRVFSSSAQK